MKRPSFFFSQGDCGCSSNQDDPPCGPPTGATVSDNRYFTLGTASKGQVIVVPKGGNSQSYLTGANTGFLIWKDGEVTVVPSPTQNITLHNPWDGAAFPVPNDFQFLMMATGDPMVWKVCVAPSVGSYMLQSINGVWTLKPAGSIPGLDAIGASALTALKGGLLVIIEPDPVGSPGVYAIRRLAVADKHAVIGYVDPITFEESYKTVNDAEALTHTILQSTQQFFFRTITSLDGAGVPIAGGFEQAITTGLGSIADPTRMVFSPTTKRIYLAPPNTVVQTKVTTGTGLVTVPGAYAAIPAGHGAGSSNNYNYATVRIDFIASLGATENVSFGIFRDNALLAEFPFTTTLDVSIFYVDTGVPPGAHTYEIRWKKISGTNQMSVGQSALLVTTIQQ